MCLLCVCECVGGQAVDRFRLVFSRSYRRSVNFFIGGAEGETSLWKSIFCTKTISSPLTSFSPFWSAWLCLTLTHSHHPDNPADRVNITCSSYVHIVRWAQHTHMHTNSVIQENGFTLSTHPMSISRTHTHSLTHTNLHRYRLIRRGLHRSSQAVENGPD